MSGGSRNRKEQAPPLPYVHSRAWALYQHPYCTSESSSTAALVVSAGPREGEESWPIGCSHPGCLRGLCASGGIPPPVRLSWSQLEEAGKLLLPKYLFSLCTEAGTKAQKSLLQSSVWCGTWETWEIVEPKIERDGVGPGVCVTREIMVPMITAPTPQPRALHRPARSEYSARVSPFNTPNQPGTKH